MYNVMNQSIILNLLFWTLPNRVIFSTIRIIYFSCLGNAFGFIIELLLTVSFCSLIIPLKQEKFTYLCRELILTQAYYIYV